jgi:2-keto-4-pentenoate hydratase/2-oxohepta-3-ene-1,7-dioic acid hydratase in catechol pathway
MKIVVYGPDRRVGVVSGDDVIDVEGAYAKLARETQDHPSPYAIAAATTPSDLEQFIQLGDRAIEGTQQAVEYLITKAGDRLGPRGETLAVPEKNTKLHAPLAHRGVKICMAGANYADHLFDMARAQNPDVTMEQVKEQSRQRGISGFWKLAAFVVDPEDEIVYPAKTKYLDYEGEVTLVIGKRARDARVADLLDHVWGYTLQNDWSARDQRDNVIGSLAFASMKNWDCSSSIGPFIAVGEIKDPQDIPFQTRVNGELRQDGNTKDMTFSFAEYLEHVTRDITFQAGDMIAAGTCKGTAMDSTPRVEGGDFAHDKLFLKVGDVVEVSSPLLGVLQNRIVAKQR